MLHDPTHHIIRFIDTISNCENHMNRENYKEIHERRLYKRIFQNMKDNMKKIKDGMPSMPPISLYHHHQLNNKRIKMMIIIIIIIINMIINSNIIKRKKKTKNKKQTNNNQNLKKHKSIAFMKR